MKKIIYFMVAMLIFPVFTEAGTCTDKEKIRLNTLATNIKAGYTVIDVPIVYEEQDPDYDGEPFIIEGGYSYFQIYINNLTENFYAIITSKALKRAITVNPKDLDENGTYTLDIDQNKILKEYDYDIRVYGVDTCNKKLFRSIKFKTPKYNINYGHNLCKGIEEYELCQQFYSYDVEYDDFVKRVTDYKNNLAKDKAKDKNENDPTFIDNILDFIVDNKYYIIGTIGVIGVGLIVVRIVIKRRRIL